MLEGGEGVGRAGEGGRRGGRKKLQPEAGKERERRQHLDSSSLGSGARHSLQGIINSRVVVLNLSSAATL